MKYLKKLSAITIIASIVLSNTMTFAATINDATAALDWTVAVGQTITITSTGNFPNGDEIASATITDLDGTATANATTLTAGWDNGVDDTSVLTIAVGALTDNTSYFITFTTVSGNYGTTTLRAGSPTNDIFTVSATVDPVLKFGIESSSDDLGVLTTAFGGGVTTGLEVGTNAVNGVTITATSTNEGLASTTASHTINDTTNDALYDAEGYQFTGTLGASDSAGTATISGVVATNVDDWTPTVTVYSADMPQNYDTTDYDVDFNVDAKIAESTPSASDYTDVIVFTATANF